MKKIKQFLVAVGTALLGIAAAVASVFYFRQRRQTAAVMAKELAQRGLKETEKRAAENIKTAREAAISGWNEDQKEVLKKVHNEARNITPTELFNRLRGN